jgi:hypothetical protein
MRLEPLTFLSPFVESAIESLLTRILKPSDVKARLNTIGAYCIYYPIYKSIQRLGVQNQRLIEELVASLKEDPAIFVRLLPQIGCIGPSKPSINADVKELFKRNSNLLYLPEPFFKELDVKAKLSRISDLIKQGNLEGALEEAERNFKVEYERGDIQAPGVEEVIEDVLILLTAILKLGKKLNYAVAKTVAEYYYAVLVFERSLEQFPATFMTILSLFLPLETFSTALERLRTVQQVLPSGQKVMLNPYIAQILRIGASALGFGYDEFKRAFEEAEDLLRRMG